MARQRSMEKIQSSEYVSIGELVRITGMRYSTLKYYTEEGMLPFEQEDERLTRKYARVGAVKRLETIRNYKEQGLTIDEMKRELKETADGKGTTGENPASFYIVGKSLLKLSYVNQ